ncbi:hypothetical protein Pcinc_031982 [Petrolisthes cinctipes]|uniref:Sulfotransferase domain-containing protein n=1 Tax=Petrolisthes cinctipes TaxID=88211 RepID=A0AAE1EV11_PETCI|nr:hypothetical protein Pcinc_031982 [Petrolisthes cinctipes]
MFQGDQDYLIGTVHQLYTSSLPSTNMGVTTILARRGGPGKLVLQLLLFVICLGLLHLYLSPLVDTSYSQTDEFEELKRQVRQQERRLDAVLSQLKDKKHHTYDFNHDVQRNISIPKKDSSWDDDGSERNILLVGSTARSGTSFIGEMLAKLEPSIYFFEPELYIKSIDHEKVKEMDGINLMEDVFECRFHTNFTQWLLKRNIANVIRHPVTRKCKGGAHTCLSQPVITQACQQEHVRIVKAIRLRMRWMYQLLDNDAVDNLKIIHLVRDPRGSLYSMDKNHLHKLDTAYFCPRIHDDLTHLPQLLAQYPKRVFSLVYEKFCLDPFGEARRLWRFLMDNSSATLPSIWTQYLTKKTNDENNGKKTKVYTTRRNSSTQYQEWRNTIPDHTFTSIERDCANAITALGYNLFGNIENTRNLAIPLFMDDKTLKS